MLKVAVLGTEKNLSQKDLKIMADHLEKSLNELEGVKADRVTLSSLLTLDFSLYDVLVFCGYDHITLAHVHLALDSGRDINLYDEPGQAIERELNSVLFSGMGCGRIPPSSLSRITHSWTYRDILGLVKTKLRQSNASDLSRTNSSTGSEPDRTRQVEATGKTQTRKGTRTAKTTDKPPEKE